MVITPKNEKIVAITIKKTTNIAFSAAFSNVVILFSCQRTIFIITKNHQRLVAFQSYEGGDVPLIENRFFICTFMIFLRYKVVSELNEHTYRLSFDTCIITQKTAFQRFRVHNCMARAFQLYH